MNDTTTKSSIINGKNVYDFNCAICHEVYEDPRLLQCSHSFCLKCIISYMRQKFDENYFEPDIRCPVCRAGFNSPWSRLRNFLTEVSEERDVDTIFPRNIALASATDSLSIEREFCTEHPSKIYDHFCTCHRLLCCSKCILKTHRECTRVIDIDECDKQTFEDLLLDSQQQLLTSYKACEQKLASLAGSRQKMLKSLETMKSDVIDTITKAQHLVQQLVHKEIKNVKQTLGPPPTPSEDGFSGDRRAFVVEIQNITSRITKCKRANSTGDLDEKLAAPIRDARASIKRKLDSGVLNSSTAKVAKRTI